MPRATSAVPTLTVGRATSTIGAAASLTIPDGRIVSFMMSGANSLQPQANDNAGAAKGLESGDSTLLSQVANLGMDIGSLPGDGTNTFLKNTFGGNNDIAYYYWTFS